MMGLLGIGQASASDTPITRAIAARQNNRNRILIVGGGKRCENLESSSHMRHPAGAVTLALPEGKPGLFVEPQIEADVTDAASVRKAVPNAGNYDVVHFENVDSTVVATAGAMASAHAMLKGGGLLFIETGGVHAQHTLTLVKGYLSVLGFTGIHSDTSNGLQIVATKLSGDSGVRLH